MAAGDLAKLDRNPFSNDTYPATFSAGGKVYSGVKVRARGSWSRSWPKKSLKIHFDHDDLFEGHQSLNLNSGWRDPAFVREPLAYYVYAACGVPASRSRLVRVEVNGRFRGMYIEVEQPEKEFLHRFDLKGATVFKAITPGRESDERDLGSDEAYRREYRRENHKTEGYAELQQFCRELRTAPNTLDFFNRRMDVEKYINYLAGTVLTQNWDCFNKNHCLVYDGNGSQKWLVVPWDLDRTFGDYWDMTFDQAELPILLGTRRYPGTTGWNRIEESFLGEPSLRARFLDRLEELLQSEFTTQKLFPLLDQWEKQMAPEAAQDRRRWPGTSPDFHEGIAEVKSYIERRRAFLLRELPRVRRSGPAPVRGAGPPERRRQANG